MKANIEQTSFTGATRYVLDEELAQIVNISMALEMPLLLKGEPGTGKTQLAVEVARALGKPLHEWHIKSTTKAEAEKIMREEILRHLDGLSEDQDVMLKLTLPSEATRNWPSQRRPRFKRNRRASCQESCR